MNDVVIFSDAGIDDLFAIEYLLRNKYNVKAIVATAGNGCSKRAYDVLSHFFANHTKIYLGNTANEKTHKIHEAIESLSIPTVKKKLSFCEHIEYILATPVCLISLAPLTDIASITANKNITRMLIMGGNYIVSGNDNFFSEYNFRFDAVSANKVISLLKEKTIIPLDVTSKVRFTKQHIDIIKNKDLQQLGNALLLHYNLLGENSIPLHDLTAVMYLTNPDCFVLKHRCCHIIEGGEAKGKLVCDEHRYKRRKANCVLACDVEITPLHYAFVEIFK